MRTIQDKCTPSISFETEASVGINALADSLKTPLAVYRLSEPYVRVERKNTHKIKFR